MKNAIWKDKTGRRNPGAEAARKASRIGRAAFPRAAFSRYPHDIRHGVNIWLVRLTRDAVQAHKAGVVLEIARQVLYDAVGTAYKVGNEVGKVVGRAER